MINIQEEFKFIALNVEKIKTLYYFISLTKNEIVSNHKKERTRKFRYPNINNL